MNHFPYVGFLWWIIAGSTWFCDLMCLLELSQLVAQWPVVRHTFSTKASITPGAAFQLVYTFLLSPAPQECMCNFPTGACHKLYSASFLITGACYIRGLYMSKVAVHVLFQSPVYLPLLFIWSDELILLLWWTKSHVECPRSPGLFAQYYDEDWGY